jgi:hypothetical protein
MMISVTFGLPSDRKLDEHVGNLRILVNDDLGGLRFALEESPEHGVACQQGLYRRETLSSMPVVEAVGEAGIVGSDSIFNDCE